ncbi:MAG: acyltransferase family protein [Chryseobacterium jejuense]|uniref:acyltransferase family protein n=1 Tax=Chryseobacterium jejuense TaxID=445960 RepID=UPI003D11DC1E
MNIDSYLFILICYSSIFISGFFISRIVNFKTATNRFESIDGFRGLLATGVFIHHSIIWKNYLNSNIWELPKNHLAIHLGESSVAFFFMITSFLFTNKLLKSGNQNLTFWRNLLYSRIFRLFPLYFFVVTICIFFALVIDHFVLNSTLYVFLAQCIKWYMFNIKGKVIIGHTYSIDFMLAGVVWSLPYEWLFYFTLPIIGTLMIKNKNVISIIVSILFILVYINHNTIRLTHIISFLGGMVPAIIHYFHPQIKLSNKLYSLLAISCLIIGLSFDSSSRNYFSKTFLIITFTIIALGNNLFGFLKINFLKFLGEISYSTYLVHGILLFTTFYFIGFDTIKNMNGNTYMFLIFIIAIFLNIICSFTFYLIEKPFINLYYKIISKKQA